MEDLIKEYNRLLKTNYFNKSWITLMQEQKVREELLEKVHLQVVEDARKELAKRNHRKLDRDELIERLKIINKGLKWEQKI